MSVNAQELTEKFTVNSEGVNGQIVIEAEGSAMELYQNAKRHLQDRFVNPDNAILLDMEGETLRYKAFSPTLWTYKAMLVSADYYLGYVMTIDFKDGRMRLTYSNMESRSKFSDGTRAGYDLDQTIKGLYRKNGKITSRFEGMPEAFENYMNLEALIIKSGSQGETKKDDW
ncbi:hypothetical protein AAU57_12120 [Nonlabens sp. YIK11]|nr:hypothetical protein AAU57_12120 [Nonlabens sp. YIK11]